MRGPTGGAIRKSKFMSGTAKVLRSLHLPCVPNPRDVPRESEAETNTNPPVRECSTHISVPRRLRTDCESPVSVHEVFSSSENADAITRFAAARTLRVSNPDLHTAVLSADSFGEMLSATRAPGLSSWFHDDETEEALAQLRLPIQTPPQQEAPAPAKQPTRAPANPLSWSTSTQQASSLARVVASVHPSELTPLPAPTHPADPHLSAYPLLTDFDLNPSLQGPYSRFPAFLPSTVVTDVPQTQIQSSHSNSQTSNPQTRPQIPQIQIKNPTPPSQTAAPPAQNDDPASKRISLLNWRPKHAPQAAPPVTDVPTRTKARTDDHGDVILHRHQDAFVAPEEGVPFCPPSFRGEEAEGQSGRTEEVRKWRGSELFLPERAVVGAREDVVDEVLGEIVEEEEEEQEQPRLEVAEEDFVPCNPARLSKPFETMVQLPLQPMLEVTKVVKRKAPLEDELSQEGASRATRMKRTHPIALRATHGVVGRMRQVGVRGRQGQEAVELPGDWDTTVERQMGMQAWRTWRMSLGAPFVVERVKFQEGGFME